MFSKTQICLLQCFLSAVSVDLFIAFVLVHSFAVGRLGALEETFKVMRHSSSHDCDQF